ncbi:MAG: hypothetical protein NTY19_02265 [Planctomycetota bacterium]|nr:hypothetical protein [Planctomycetota bacterium]
MRQGSYALVPTDLSTLKHFDTKGNYRPNHDHFSQPDGIPLYSFLDLKSGSGLGVMHFGKPDDNPGKTFGVALYELDKSSVRKTHWTVFELNQEHLDVFQSRCGRFQTLRMLVKLLDATGNVLDEQDLVPEFLKSMIVPLPGTTKSPPVALEGIRNAPEDNTQWVSVTLDLVNPGMTEEDNASRNMPMAVAGDTAYRNRMSLLFPIAPLFNYSLWWNGAQAYSSEARFAVTFKGLEVGTVEKVKKVECSVSILEKHRKDRR